MSKPKRTTYFPADELNISFALPTCMIPVIPTVMIPSPIAIILSIHSPTSSKPNNAMSMNAVGFAILAQANITQEMMIYLSESR